MTAPTLIIGYGNLSRGDDALGPLAIAALEKLAENKPEWGEVEFLTDYQLQIEFVTDLYERERVIFIDATASGNAQFTFEELREKQDVSLTSHALSPAALLTVYRNYHGAEAPVSYLLAIRGYEFGLGVPLSDFAKGNLDAALAMLSDWMTENVSLPSHA